MNAVMDNIFNLVKEFSSILHTVISEGGDSHS